MDRQIVILNNDIDKIKDISVEEMARIIKTGVVHIERIEKIVLPKDSIEIYMFLISQFGLSNSKKEFINIPQEIINQILTNQESVIQNKQSLNNEEPFLFLEDQIIESIVSITPNIINQYDIDLLNSKKQKFKDNRKDNMVINIKNLYGIGNILKICLFKLKQAKEFKIQYEECMNLLKKYIIPIYFQFSHDQLSKYAKNILSCIKNMLQYFNTNAISKQLSNYYTQIYHNYWRELSFDNQNINQVKSLQNHLTLCQLIHHHLSYHHQLSHSKILKSHIKSLFQYKGQSKITIHLLALNIYQKLIKELNQSNAASQIFINLFGMLSCYGTHLIKDAWLTIHSLIQTKQSSLFEHLELVNLILLKCQNHSNSNVIKNCFNQLIKNENSNILFTNIPSLVYSNVIRLLNLGLNYTDSMFHMDSKFYPVISSFFLKYYDHPQTSISTLEMHLKWLLQSISKLGFDHGLIALMQIFPSLKRKTSFIESPHLDLITNLLKNAYSRYPIRKRYQLVDGLLSLLQNHLHYQTIHIYQVFQFLININTEYLILDKLQNIQRIINKFDPKMVEAWIFKISFKIIEDIKQNVIYQRQEFDYGTIHAHINMIQLYYKLYEVKFSHYEDFFMEMIYDYGQSQYKSIRQREFIIKVYHQIQKHLLSLCQSTKQFQKHLQSVLNIIVFYAQKSSVNQKQIKYEQINKIVTLLFHKIYSDSKYENFKERQGERVILARMLQWANDKICEYRIALQIITQALRARVQVILSFNKQPQYYQGYQHLFQQTLFDIFNQITALQQSNWKITNRLSNLSRDKQLRLKVLLNSALMHDQHHVLNKSPPSCQDIRDYIDRYDFYNYEEICWLIEAIYTKPHRTSQRIYLPEKFTQEEAANIAKQLQLLLQNILHNLQYSLSKKQIISISSATISIIFNLALDKKLFYPQLINFAIKLIKIGENNFIFQRSVSLLVIKQFREKHQQILTIDCTNLIPLITAILTIEQYRGFDSAIYLYQENNKMLFYREFIRDIQYNYYGTLPRFLFIKIFREILTYGKKMQVQYFTSFSKIINYVFGMCMAVVGKQKMFLSGKNKIKLQMWQFLLLFNPQFLPCCLKPQNIEEILLNCIELIGSNTISQIRYYSQIFLMRILLHQQNFTLITIKLLLLLRNGLFNSVGNVNKNVSYMIISGILINHISIMSQNNFSHFMNIKEAFINLYNSLLTYTCSSVAYFRGLSQYFCLQNIAGCLQTKYVSILRQNYLLDPDAVTLKQKLSKIIINLVAQIKKWQINSQILSKIPNSNHNVISNEYYMQKFKALAIQLAKTVKNEDGFTAYRYIWKKNISLDEKQDEIQQIKEDIQQNQKGQEEQVFQRKIDPTFDFIYGSESRSQFKILITSAKSQALLGHMARTGEIFGISELFVPSLKILEKQQFKSISVTAEKWLKITQIGNSTNKKESLLSLLIKHKLQGYQLIKISKKPRQMNLNRQISLQKKCLLILDQQQTLSAQCLKTINKQLQLSYYFSLHVQASIIIWQYFKKYLNTIN